MKIESMKAENLPGTVKAILEEIDNCAAFDAGGWVAGGFARQLTHHYLLKPKTDEDWQAYVSKRSGLRPGDIDVFLPKQVNHPHFETVLKSLPDSYAGFAKDLEFRRLITVQFITDPKFRYDSLKDCFEGFDLRNSRYAITGNRHDGFTLHWDVEALESDRLKRVDIMTTISPFLGARVLKYIQRRGCTRGLMPASDALLVEWLIRAATGSWPDNFTTQHLNGIQGQVMKLRDAGYVETSELAFFINRWTTHSQSGSGYNTVYKEVDWAIDQIAQATR